MRMMKPAFCFAMLAAISAPALAGQIGSSYSEVYSDIGIGNSDATVLNRTIYLSSPRWVYVQSDGRVFPSGGSATAAVWVSVDGASVSNVSVVDWSVSQSPQQHSYNAIGAVYLSAGAHTVSLHARSLNSRSFTLGANSNLSALVGPAGTVRVATRGTDSGVLSYNVGGLNGQSPLPNNAQVTVPINGAAGGTLVALASSRIYQYGNPGDPLTSIGFDGATLPNNQASWSDNDMYKGAENQAPFFTHALVTGLSPTPHNVSLITSALPYSGGSNNNVQYKMGGDAKVVTLQGGMSVVGSAPLAYDPNNVINYACIATSINWSGCPAAGTNVVLAKADIVVPAGHNGVVMITGKTRIQADSADGGGVSYLFLTVDGVRHGSLGVQQLQSPNSVSTRTLGTSYLATGSQALSPGVHHVVLYAQGTGNFRHLSVTRDLPLIWFD